MKSYFLPESTFPGLFVRTFVWLGLLILGHGAVAKAAAGADARVGNNTNAAQPAPGSPTPTTPEHLAPKRLQAKLAGTYPVSFTPLAGPHGARYVSQGIHYALALDSSGLSIATTQSRPAAKAGPLDHAHASNSRAGSLPAALQNPQTSSIHVQFLGAAPNARIQGLDPTGAKTNYLIGNNPALWQRNLPSYKRVRYQAIYPGIDLIYYSSMQQKLEYDMVIRPGADPSQIRFRVDGQHQPTIDAAGNLVLDGANGIIRLNRPLFYQDVAGKRQTTLGTFRQIAKNEFGFAAVPYDHSKPLIIDPTIILLYSTYLGGVNDDEVYGMSVDKAGDAYLVGASYSPNFPTTANAYQSSYQGVDIYHVVVAKFDPSGTLLYSTFLGGTSNDIGESIAVTPDGEVWVGGTATSTNFPLTSGAYQSSPGGMFPE
ncbi:MAG: SBBP repeat-containing protein [Acidobacteriaceae bacterium]